MLEDEAFLHQTVCALSCLERPWVLASMWRTQTWLRPTTVMLNYDMRQTHATPWAACVSLRHNIVGMKARLPECYETGGICTDSNAIEIARRRVQHCKCQTIPGALRHLPHRCVLPDALQACGRSLTRKSERPAKKHGMGVETLSLVVDEAADGNCPRLHIFGGRIVPRLPVHHDQDRQHHRL